MNDPNFPRALKPVSDNIGLFMLDIHLPNKNQKVISTIYELFKSTGKWPGARTIRKELGKTLVESVLARNKPRLVEKFEDNRVEYYRLNLHGFLACPSAKDDIQMLLKYLDFLKNKFEENPEIREITSIEVEQALILSKEQSKRLSALIYIGGLWGGSASFGGDEWRVGVFEGIEDLIESNSPDDYLKNRLKKEEKRQKEYEKKYSKIDKFRLLSWLSFNVNLWLLFYVVFSLSPKSLPITIFIISWFALYSISKVCEDIFKKKIPFFSAEKVLEKVIWWIVTIIISGAAGIISKILSN